MNWPNDADGDVFRRLEEKNFDFDSTVQVDFNIDFDHWPLSKEEQEFVKGLQLVVAVAGVVHELVKDLSESAR